jgi:hypothetical protein
MNIKRSTFHGGLVLRKIARNIKKRKSEIRDGHSYQGAQYLRHRNVPVSGTAAYVTSVNGTLTEITY